MSLNSVQQPMKLSIQADKQTSSNQSNQRKSTKKESSRAKDSMGNDKPTSSSKTATQINRINPHAINVNGINFLNQQKIAVGEKGRVMREVQNNSHLNGNTK